MKTDFDRGYDCGYGTAKSEEVSRKSESVGSANGMPKASEFYLGIEWLGAWLVDHAEGEIVSEELIVGWCSQAWAKHILRKTTLNEE